ncbi:MAG: hydrocarbon degradation protein [Saprospiraceae bacterium]|nr:MAG: hydrocarbon degradation protein [Saprospiraceae bacterium]
MKSIIIALFSLLMVTLHAQTGHVLQGSGAVNFSMGGAATALPIDAAGSLQWNPASITAFGQNELSASVAWFTAAPEVYAKVVQPDGQGGFMTIEGLTKDEMGASPLPTLGVVFSLPDSKFAFGISAFGVSGFGVDYPATTNLPVPGNPNFDPTRSNPLLYPQSMGGFGHLFSEYQLMQLGLTTAYDLGNGLSVGLAPTFNYSTLQIEPVPIAAPNPELGYPIGDKATALGMGFQAGLFYQTDIGLNAGLSYKSTQWFEDLEIGGKYPDGSTAPATNFNMDFPAIISAGIGFSSDMIDVAVDYRFINYSKTDGFEKTGWVIGENGYPTGAVAGFGWKDVHVVGAGLQFKGIDKLPLRVGYTFSTNPITEDNVFFSSPAPAVIENAVQFGLGYELGSQFNVSLTYHRGLTAEVSGQLMNPQFITAEDPLGKVPQSEITSKMHTDVLLLGVSYKFGR